MNENDLSDEAARKVRFVVTNPDEYPFGILMWKEAVRRAKANPWQLLPDGTLAYIINTMRHCGDTHSLIHNQIEAEFGRRKS